MDCTLQTVGLSCSIIAGDYNTCAHCDTVEKSDHQKNQTSGRTDGSECVAAEKVADDQGVGGIIKLLEQISDQNGQEKLKNQFAAVFAVAPVFPFLAC